MSKEMYGNKIYQKEKKDKMICSKVDDLYIWNLYSEAGYEGMRGNMEFSVIYEFRIINLKLKLIDIQLLVESQDHHINKSSTHHQRSSKSANQQINILSLIIGTKQ